MDIIDMARASGLTVILDGRIGREDYQSVCGSVFALQRFAESLRQCAARGYGSIAQRPTRPVASGQVSRRNNKLERIAGANATPAQRISHIARWRQK